MADCERFVFLRKKDGYGILLKYIEEEPLINSENTGYLIVYELDTSCTLDFLFELAKTIIQGCR